MNDLWQLAGKMLLRHHIDIRLTFSEAALNKAVNLVGNINELARPYEAILVYIRGGVR